MNPRDDPGKAYRDGLTRGRDESRLEIDELEIKIQVLKDESRERTCTCGRTAGHLWDCPANPAY